MLFVAHFVPNINLPKPIIFGYNYLVAVETLKELKKLPEFSCVDSIILMGSSVKPKQGSKGKDIDFVIFLKENISWQQQDKAERKLRGIMADSCRKFGAHFDSGLFPSTIVSRTEDTIERIAIALSLKRLPYKILFATHRSWVKSSFQKIGARSRAAKFHKKAKSGITKSPLPRKPKPR